MNTPLISVIVTTYNRKDLLAKTLQSILAQTYTHIEVIVVDNYSNYDFFAFIKSLNDDRLRAFQHKNGGVIAVNRNFGIGQAKGEYLAFCDDDDLWKNEKLEKLYSLKQENPKIEVFFSKEQFIDQDSKILEQFTHLAWQKNQIISFEDFFFHNLGSPSASFIKKSALEKLGGFDQNPCFFTVEDYHCWLKLSAQHLSFYCAVPLGYFRVHTGATTNTNAEKQLVYLHNALVDIWQKNPEKIKAFQSKATWRLKKVQLQIAKYYLLKSSWKNFFKWFSKALLPLKIENEKMVLIA